MNRHPLIASLLALTLLQVGSHGLAAEADTASQAAAPGVATKTAHAIERGLRRGAAAVGRGAQRAGQGIRHGTLVAGAAADRGAKATGRAVDKASRKTTEGIRRGADRIGLTSASN